MPALTTPNTLLVRRLFVAALAVLCLAATAAVSGAASAFAGPDRPTIVAGAAPTEPVHARAALRGFGDRRGDASGYLHGVSVEPSVDPDASLPQPEGPPVDPYAPTPATIIGTLTIPAIGLEQPLYEGVTLTSINRGPSHWPGTAMPGELGNVVVAGHRTTYTRPFWALDELEPGDALVFTVGDERVVYELERLEVVSPEAMHIINQTHEHRATLFACHPRGSARQRIVAHFRLRPAAPVFTEAPARARG